MNAMIRIIVPFIVAGPLIAGAAGCKKKEGEAAAAKATEGTGIPVCDAYIKAMEKFTTCDKLPPEQKKAYASSLDASRRSFAEAKDKAATAEQCTGAMAGLVEGAKARNCPLE